MRVDAVNPAVGYGVDDGMTYGLIQIYGISAFVPQP